MLPHPRLIRSFPRDTARDALLMWVEMGIREGIQISVFIHNKIIFIMNILGLQMSQEYLPVDRKEERGVSFIAFQ